MFVEIGKETIRGAGIGVGLKGFSLGMLLLASAFVFQMYRGIDLPTEFPGTVSQTIQIPFPTSLPNDATDADDDSDDWSDAGGKLSAHHTAARPTTEQYDHLNAPTFAESVTKSCPKDRAC